jgi:hypothetical protein
VQLPRELDDLVHQMLAKDPAARPDLSRVHEVIESVLDPAQRPTTVLPAEARKRPSSPAMPWWLIALIVALGAAGAFALIHGLVG